MAYQKIQVNTGLAAAVFASDTNHIPAAASVQTLTGVSKQVLKGSTTSGVTDKLVSTSSNFNLDTFTVVSWIKTTSTTGSHTHSYSGSTFDTGGGQAHENRPPYYTLAFIMKL